MSKNLMVFSVLLIASVLIVISYFSLQEEESLPATNYKGLVLLHLAPNSEPREPTSKDIDTGVSIGFDGDVYRLYESRTFEEGDFGKTFVKRVG